MNKYLVLVFLLLITSPVYADRTGQVVAAGVTVGDSDNTFASGYCDEIQGCGGAVADITARNAITTERRVLGMTAYVISENKTYRLVGGVTNSNWAEVTSGGWTDGGTTLYNTTSTDNVGIGTTVASQKLTVAGNIQQYPSILEENQVTDCAEGVLNINVNSFTTSGLISFNGNQYVGYWDCNRNLVVGKRALPNGAWTLYPFDGSGGRPTLTMQDYYHNGVALGVDTEGFIHMSYNMHADSLLYRKSDVTEDPSLMTISTMVGTNETTVTYPRFFNNPTNGKLYFTFRSGTAGSGDQYLYEYSTTTDIWTAVGGSAGKIIDGIASAPDRSPYIYKAPKFSPNGNMHWAFSYRVLGDESETDVVHFYWNGVAGSGGFFQTDGTSQAFPIQASNDVPVESLTVSDGVASMSGMDIDGNNRPHIAYVKDDANEFSQIWHAWWNGSAWVIKQLTDTPTRTWPATIGDNNTKFPDISRPEIILDRTRNVAYIIYRDFADAPGILVLESKPNDFTSWSKYRIYDGEVGYWEAQYDRQQWETNKVLYLLVSPVSGWNTSNTSTPLSVLRWDPSTSARIYGGGIKRDVVSIQDIDIISLTGVITLQTPTGIVVQAHRSDPDKIPYAELPKIYGDPLNDYFTQIVVGNVLDTLGTDGKLLYGWINNDLVEQDLSGKAHTTTSTWPLTEQVTKNLGWMRDFDGTLSVATADSDDFSFGNGTLDTPFSVFAWIRVADTATTQMIVSKQSSATGAEAREWYFSLNSSEKPVFTLIDESVNVLPTRTADTGLTAGSYYFVVATYDGVEGATALNGAKIYVNGIVVASTAANEATYVAMENTATVLRVGASYGPSDLANFFTDPIGMVGIVGRELTAQEIWTLYVKTRGLYGE